MILSRLVITIPVTAALMGCTAALERQGPVTLPIRRTDGIELLASKRGILVVHEGCLRLRGESGGRFMIVWPEGTVFRQGAPATVTDPRGRTRRVGELVELQGGGASAENFDPATHPENVIRRCGGGPVFLADGFLE